MPHNFDSIIKSFLPNCGTYKVEPLGSGHINDTYKVTLSGNEERYVLQRINRSVFGNPLGLAETHSKLCNHWEKGQRQLQIAKITPNISGSLIHSDKLDEAWRLTEFIVDSYSIEVASEPWQAFEAGRGFGWFLKLCSSLDTAEFQEAIKDFHSVSHRLNQLHNAVDQNLSGRLENVSQILDFFLSRRGQMVSIEALLKSGKIPTRVVHNDTKINNLLFQNQKAVAVIDLDTVGPGSILYDYGDALRTVASTATEDEKNLTKVDFCLERFSNFTAGFTNEVNGFITKEEKKHLCNAPAFMTYIMGTRFLADYINGDIYYKTKYPEHNLVRAQVQQKLIESMEEKELDMKSIIKKAFDKSN